MQTFGLEPCSAAKPASDAPGTRSCQSAPAPTRALPASTSSWTPARPAVRSSTVSAREPSALAIRGRGANNVANVVHTPRKRNPGRLLVDQQVESPALQVPVRLLHREPFDGHGYLLHMSNDSLSVAAHQAPPIV